MRPTREDELSESISRFIASWGEEGDFNSLALDLFAYQFENCPPYRSLCEFLGRSPTTAREWSDVPAVPVEAFKQQILNCSGEPPAARFLTSGTTSGARGQHWLSPAGLRLYDLSLKTAFDRLASRASHLPLRALAPHPSEAPESSLSHMLGALAGRAENSPARFYWREGGPDLPRARRELAEDSQPVLLFTTAFALIELLDSLEQPLRLPAGSLLIETGGFKGRSRSLERGELYQLAFRQLGIPLSSIGAEYGMCEMTSQFYDQGLQSAQPWNEASAPVKQGPPWVRTAVVDPAIGTAVHRGQQGILRHFDLANINSCASIETEDTGILVETGFVLLGRLENAAPRGCSLTVEEWRNRTTGVCRGST